MQGDDELARLSVVTWRVPKVDARGVEAALLAPGAQGVALARDAMGARGVCYLSTCQRVTWVLDGAPHDAPDRLRAHYKRTGKAGLATPEAFHGFEAFRHLCMVASSLDSLVPGEPQILGQFKRAVVTCIAAREASPAFRHLLGLVLRAAKTVRAQTRLFEGKVSLLSLAEGPIRAALGQEPNPTVAVCGTGEMGSKAARLIRRVAPRARLVCVGRDMPRAKALATSVSGEPLALHDFLDHPPRMQALVLAMAPYRPIFQPGWLLMQALRGPLAVIDLGLPRNAKAPDPMPDGLTMHQLDDLAAQAESSKAHRGAAYQNAMDLLENELAKVKQELEARRSAETLRSLSQRFEQIAQERWTGLEPLVTDGKARRLYDRTVRALLHEATQVVKANGGEPPR